MRWISKAFKYSMMVVISALLSISLFSTRAAHLSAEDVKPYSCQQASDKLDPVGDEDDDGLTNEAEIDGMPTDDYGRVFTDPCMKDTDEDGLDDNQEHLGTGHDLDVFPKTWNTKTDPNNSDTDGDGIKDGDEIRTAVLHLHGTFMSANDEDFITFRSNPTEKDTDGDELEDQLERDGWLITVDGKSINVKSSPQHADTDDDGFTDKEEHDGLPSESEPWGIVQTNPSHEDTDEDGYTDLEEIDGIGDERIKLNPTRRDTDGDGLDDGLEVKSQGECDPLQADQDGNGLADGLNQWSFKEPSDLNCSADGLDRVTPSKTADPASMSGLDKASSSNSDIQNETGGKEYPASGDTGTDTDRTSGSQDKSSSRSTTPDRVEAPGGPPDARATQVPVGTPTVRPTAIPTLSPTVLPTDKIRTGALLIEDQASDNGLKLGQISAGAIGGLVAGAFIALGARMLVTGGDRRYGNDTRPGERHIENELHSARAVIQAKDVQLDRLQLQLDQQRSEQQAGNITESTRLRGESERLMEQLSAARVALAGRIAATQRAIPDAMLEEARGLIEGVDERNVVSWNLRLNRADSLIGAVSRFFLGR